MTPQIQQSGKTAAQTQTMELIINDKVYDVTGFAKKHPGGSIIKFQVGTDATDAYREFHRRTGRADKILKTLPSRDVTAADKKQFFMGNTAALEDFRKLETELRKEGVFDPSMPHVMYRLAEVFGMHVVGLALVAYGWTIPGLVILGIVQGRCGWLMHEGGHHSLTGNITIDQHLQMFLYGVGCGMSGAFWRNQHNKHHCTPQKLKHDVDLDTLPLVAFNEKIAKYPFVQRNPIIKKWISWQAVLFAPVTCLLVSLGWQLFLHPRHSLRTGRYLELFWMGVRYAVIAALGMAHYGTVGATVAAYVFYVWVGGTYIFCNFAVSHTHLDVVDKDDHADWLSYSADYTMNVKNVWWVNWWMAFLNFQIEHHLFPSCPQYRFPSVSPRVKALFKKHNLPYKCMDYTDAMRVTFKNLATVGEKA